MWLNSLNVSVFPSEVVLLPELMVIAEAGVNHNGSLKTALELVDVAKMSGVHVVKFQSFSALRLASKSPPLVDYQLGSAKTHFEMLRELELSREDHERIFRHCNDIGIEFMSTPYSADDAQFLAELGVKRMKTASADVTDFELHEFLANQFSGEVIASTGMASLEEVVRLTEYYEEAGRKESLFLLQCVSSYPASPRDQNLLFISKLKELVENRVGFSDHSLSSTSSLVALGLGARIFEKHFTLDKGAKGPDHATSLDPVQLRAYIVELEEGYSALGTGLKAVLESEQQMQRISRKGIYLARDVRVGDILTRDDVFASRPAMGVDAWEILKALPAKVTKDGTKGDPVGESVQ